MSNAESRLPMTGYEFVRLVDDILRLDSINERKPDEIGWETITQLNDEVTRYWKNNSTKVFDKARRINGLKAFNWGGETVEEGSKTVCRLAIYSDCVILLDQFSHHFWRDIGCMDIRDLS